MNELIQLGIKPLKYDNLHLIAITNARSGEKKISIWWRKKYRVPPKPFEEYTWEELILERLEDYYYENPAEADKTLANIIKPEIWDGEMPDYYEKDIKRKYKKFFDRNKVDLSKYQTDVVVSKKEEDDIINNLGRKLPGSKVVNSIQSIEEPDEFEDNF